MNALARGSLLGPIAAATVAAACWHRHVEASAAAAAATMEPRIEAVRPDSVSFAQRDLPEVTLVGTGFVPGKPGKNTLEFAGQKFNEVAANDDGTQIHFVVPQSIHRGGEAPPASLLAGSYTVRVITSAGSSNPVTIRIF